RPGLEQHEPAALAPVAEGTAYPPAVSQQPLDVALHVHVDAFVDGVLLQCTNHFQTGAVADVGQARVAMAAEVALQNATVRGAVKQRPPVLQLEDKVRRFLGVQLGHAPVIEHLAAAHGVAEVHLPAVLWVDVSEGCGDAPFGHDGVGLPQQGLADQGGLYPLGRRLDGGAETGAASADDDDVVLVSLVLVGSHIRKTSSRKCTPSTASARTDPRASPRRG